MEVRDLHAEGNDDADCLLEVELSTASTDLFESRAERPRNYGGADREGGDQVLRARH
jgi:hypothetical protein